jgi:2-polyprenyl-6-hydroxyphenyl methylase/3-demethylubiquinone-9 3-methyltransferase
MKKTLKWHIAQRAEMRWWQGYLKGKNVAEYHTWKRQYWLGLLEKIASSCPVSSGMTVLDAGCGPAGIFMALPQCHVDAMDPLLDQYAEKLPHFQKEDYSYARFFHSPLETYQPDQQYDIVFCMNAINHVSDIELCYDQLVSWVKPGGKLVVTIDAHNRSFFKHLFRIVPGDILHPHQYDLQEYAQFLTKRSLILEDTIQLKQEFFFNHYMQVATKSS